MSFFTQFPLTAYDFELSGIRTNVVDIFRAQRVINLVKDEISPYHYHDIADGDRPDVVSELVYGTPDHYWTFFLVNDFLRGGRDSWPKSSIELEKHLQFEYDSYTVFQFRQVVENVSIQHFKTGIFPNFENALNGYPARPGDPVTCISATGTVVGSGKFVKFDSTLQQLWIDDTTGDLTRTFSVRIGIDPLVLREWVSTYVPRKYDAIYFANQEPGYPLYVDPNDGTEPFYEYSPNYAAIDAALAEDMRFIIDATFLSARTAPHHYELNGLEVTNTALIGGADGNFTAVQNHEFETARNDSRRHIRVIRPELITSFSDAFEEKLNA